MLYYRPFFWTSDCVVFVADAQRRRWHSHLVFGRRNEIIYNGVDTAHWTPPHDSTGQYVRAKLGLGPGDYVVGLSAVLRPEKNHLQLVDAIASLRQRGAPAKALMIGDGPMRPAIEERARSLGVAQDIVITGLQQDVRPYLAACDATVLTSFAEAFSLAAVEAMAMQKPVVHSDVGGAAEMIHPGVDGFLFPVRDTPALVDRLATLADVETRKRMGAAARETVETRFSELAMVNRYEELLQDLESKRAAATRQDAVLPPAIEGAREPGT